MENDNSNSIESLLNTLWEKIRQAGDTISVLREDNRMLSMKLEEANRELLKARTTLEELQQSGTTTFPLFDMNGGKSFSNDEVEKLKTQVKNLLAIVNTHLE
ncbi:MAG: hypothetical protein KGZ58_03735 [Ignavibacteriales bacterium]|nr:hypothetical protein [Ignavibacteriales bacterium]